jgi:heterodisulfide reductase subunit B
MIGVTRPPREYEGDNSLCCAGPAFAINKELAIDIQHNNINDALSVGAEALITCCPMCHRALKRSTADLGIINMFVTDLVRIALGEITWPEA